MISVLTSSAVDLELEPRSGQTQEYEIGSCCFFAKRAALRRTGIDWLARNQNKVWGDMSIRGLFLLASTIKTQLTMFV
jgi:hypothetical protein